MWNNTEKVSEDMANLIKHMEEIIIEKYTKQVTMWATANPKEWNVICGTSKEELTMERFKEISQAILNKGMDDIFYVLYTRFAFINEFPIDKLMKELPLD